MVEILGKMGIQVVLHQHIHLEEIAQRLTRMKRYPSVRWRSVFGRHGQAFTPFGTESLRDSQPPVAEDFQLPAPDGRERIRNLRAFRKTDARVNVTGTSNRFTKCHFVTHEQALCYAHPMRQVRRDHQIWCLLEILQRRRRTVEKMTSMGLVQYRDAIALLGFLSNFNEAQILLSGPAVSAGVTIDQQGFERGRNVDPLLKRPQVVVVYLARGLVLMSNDVQLVLVQ